MSSLHTIGIVAPIPGTRLMPGQVAKFPPKVVAELELKFPHAIVRLDFASDHRCVYGHRPASERHAAFHLAPCPVCMRILGNVHQPIAMLGRCRVCGGSRRLVVV